MKIMPAPMNALRSTYSLVFLTLLIGLIVGFLLGSFVASRKTSPISTQPMMTNSTNASFYSNQQASVQGKITAINGKTLMVTNKAQQSGSIPLSSHFQIMKPSSGGRLSSPSADLNLLELNKDVAIDLIYEDGEMRATTIRYIPPLPAPVPPKITTSPAASNKP